MKLTKGCQIQISLGVTTIIYANITTVQNIIRYAEFRDENKKIQSIVFELRQSRPVALFPESIEVVSFSRDNKMQFSSNVSHTL